MSPTWHDVTSRALKPVQHAACLLHTMSRLVQNLSPTNISQLSVPEVTNERSVVSTLSRHFLMSCNAGDTPPSQKVSFLGGLLLLGCEPRLLWSHNDAVRGLGCLNHWSHLVQLVVRRGDGVHLVFVHQLVTLLHLFALLGSSVLEPYLHLQQQTSLSAVPGQAGGKPAACYTTC